jgi:acetylornithine deacetylase/succinyl-diaminopimelate desuccinylase-like protein
VKAKPAAVDLSSRAQRWLASHRNDLLDFATRLIAVPSANPHDDERAVVALLVDEAAKLGLEEGRIIARAPERPNLLFRVVGSHPGPSLMLVGHTDTKPAGNRNEWTSDPFQAEVRAGRLYGLGASDMKGGIAAMLYAAGAVLSVADRLQGALQLALVADEEAGSSYGAAYLVQQEGCTADAVIIGEPAGIYEEWDSLHVASRGVCLFTVRARGDQGHSGLTKVLGLRNASVVLANLVSAMSTELALTHPENSLYPDGPTVNLCVQLRGGIFWGVNPGVAECDCDVRLTPGMTREQIRLDIEGFVRSQAADYEVDWQPREVSWIDACTIDASHPLVTAVQAAASHVLGKAPRLSGYPAGTDGYWFSSVLGIPTIPAFGPGLISVAHRPNEYVSLKGIGDAADLYAVSAINYLSAR